ncbi:MAG: hypothetical protein A2W19_15880 [Spirochaetes bacterium RBG_16_49_21]|nr:MAG: hypothetical protein A2W19_15880 [Spirochaetes bacterium RBG_16_49_21]
MLLNKVPPYIYVSALLLILHTSYMHGAAVKKQEPGQKFVKPPAQYISARRVVKDFTAGYNAPQGTKTLQVYYAGKIRNFTETVGNAPVPAQGHQVALIYRLSECGIQMRDLWEVQYYKLETEWIFQKIFRIKSTQLTRNRKNLPGLADAEIKKLVSDAFLKTYGGYQAPNITVLNKKGYWNLCAPVYETSSKITVSRKDDINNTIATYECVFAVTLARRGGKWEDVKIACIYNGKEAEDCRIGSHCLQISGTSSIPEISDEEAVTLLRAGFEKEYGLIKNNVAVERFSLIKRLPAENFNKKIPCILGASIVIDENKNQTINEAGKETRTYRKVRAVYDCVVYGHLNYSLVEKKWEGIIESCCSSENERCGRPCSIPEKGCKRLGEK